MKQPDAEAVKRALTQVSFPFPVLASDKSLPLQVRDPSYGVMLGHCALLGADIQGYNRREQAVRSVASGYLNSGYLGSVSSVRAWCESAAGVGHLSLNSPKEFVCPG